MDSPLVKNGVPTDEELEELARDIDLDWKVLGRQLRLAEVMLEEIHGDERRRHEEGFRMLMIWKLIMGADANYRTLFEALTHILIKRKDLAEKYFIKNGVPTDGDLEELARDIDLDWKVLGRQLRLAEVMLEKIHWDERCRHEEGFRMLMKWKQTMGADANYRTLFEALTHILIKRKDLAEKYCITGEKEDRPSLTETGCKMSSFAVVKRGVPTSEELKGLAQGIGDLWKVIGRQLGFNERKLLVIDGTSESGIDKGYLMLMHWKHRRGGHANYKTLFDALTHALVQRNDLAASYCIEPKLRLTSSETAGKRSSVGIGKLKRGSQDKLDPFSFPQKRLRGN